MFITKKHISRRTVLRGAGATLALPLLEAMVPAATALAQTAASPKPRFVGLFVPHGMAPGHGFREGRHRLRLSVQPNRSSRIDHTVLLSGLHSRSAGRLRAPRAPTIGWRRRSCARTSRRRRPARMCIGTTIDQMIPEDRAGQSAAVLAAGGRGSGRQFEQLRRGLQLHLHEHDLVVVADAAASDGAEPAGCVRAHVRRRQHDRTAGRAPARPAS